MSLKEAIREKARGKSVCRGIRLIGMQPLDLYIRELESRPPEMYGWVQTEQFNTLRGASPGKA